TSRNGRRGRTRGRYRSRRRRSRRSRRARRHAPRRRRGKRGRRNRRGARRARAWASRKKFGAPTVIIRNPARSIMPARKIAIVTGGNRGLGLEIAKQLMKADLFVVVGARDRAKCEHAMEALKATGPNAVAFPLDVNDTHSARRFVEEVDKQHGAPGVLVNNAGVYPEATD